MLLALAILFPMLIQCEDSEEHSRGELQRGDAVMPSAQNVSQRLATGFSYPPDSQIQSRQYYLHPQPPPQFQSYRPQQSSNTYLRPSHWPVQPQRPAQNPSISETQSSPYYNRPQLNPNYNSFSTLSSNRVNDDSEEFTRPPPDPSKIKATITTKSPPRFDSYDSVRKTFTYNRNISEAMQKFATVLLSNVNYNEEAMENFMISPFSVYHMLVMIAEGSRQGTLEELKSALEIDSIDKTRDFQQYLGEALG